MSNITLIQRVVVTSFVGLGLGIFTMSKIAPQRNTAQRGIASLSTPELYVEKPTFSGKHLALIQVSLEAPFGIPADASESVQLVGWVRMNRDLGAQAHYRWELPSNVTVIEGETEGTWTQVKAGDALKVTLSVTGFSQEDLQMISLHGFTKSGDAEFGNTALITSRPQDAYELVNSQKTSASTPALKKASSESSSENRPLLKGKILR